MHRLVLAACCCLALLAAPAAAETPLPALNGDWTGSGKDRETPMQTLQPAKCRMQITATSARLVSSSDCDSVGGLQKRLKMTVTFTGNDFTGTVEQWSKQANAEPTTRTGRVTGRRTGDRAELTAIFPGLIPNAYVTLELTSAASMAMHVTALGATLTDVTYKRR